MTVYCLKASIIQRLTKHTLYTDQQVGHAADLLERISPPFVGGFVSALGGRISLHPEWREVDLQLRRVLKRSLSTATGQPVGGRAPIMRENKRQQTAPQSPIKERTSSSPTKRIRRSVHFHHSEVIHVCLWFLLFCWWWLFREESMLVFHNFKFHFSWRWPLSLSRWWWDKSDTGMIAPGGFRVCLSRQLSN